MHVIFQMQTYLFNKAAQNCLIRLFYSFLLGQIDFFRNCHSLFPLGSTTTSRFIRYYRRYRPISELTQICPNSQLMTSYRKLGSLSSLKTHFFEFYGLFYVRIGPCIYLWNNCFPLLNPFLYLGIPAEIPDFQKGAPDDVTNQICSDEAFFWTFKNGQLWKSITSSKINIFWCVFFCLNRTTEDYRISK